MYLLGVIFIGLAMQLMFSWSNLFYIYIGATLTMLSMVFIFVKSPYRSNLHNFILFFNLLVVLYNFAWIFLEEIIDKMYTYRLKMIIILQLGLVLV